MVQKLSQRYIAGPELKDAREAVRHVNAERKLATIDVLGEEITTEEEAAAIVRAYQDVFADIQRCGLDSNVSVKLTGLGLKLGYDLCRENLRTVVDDAASRGNFVRIDMEDSSTTDDTLRLYRELREEGHDNVVEGRRLVAEHALGRDDYEFQMLLGVRPALGDELVIEGHRLRIYVPFGRHWYAYSLRRLQENPKLAGYIAADTLGRLIGRDNGSNVGG